jgi:hypothetical protein
MRGFIFFPSVLEKLRCAGCQLGGAREDRAGGPERTGDRAFSAAGCSRAPACGRMPTLFMSPGETMTIKTLGVTTLLRAERLPADRSDRYTLACCGSSRGGTSLVSYFFSHANIYMGETSDLNFEDQEMSHLVLNGKKRKIIALVRKRNEAYDRWGFKLPEAAYFLQFFDGILRKPVVVFVFRNPLAVARSILLRDPIYGKDLRGFSASLQHGLRCYQHFQEQILNLECPIVLVDFERAVNAPDRLIAELCEALYLEVAPATREQMIHGVRAGGYQSSHASAEPDRPDRPPGSIPQRS